MYIYVCIYIYIYTYKYINIYINIPDCFSLVVGVFRFSTYIYIRIYVYISTYKYICVFVYIYIPEEWGFSLGVGVFRFFTLANGCKFSKKVENCSVNLHLLINFIYK
jgi:hypothetical protein